jgi:hypothetical protein
MVIRTSRGRQRGALMTELVVAMAILMLASLPLAYEFVQEIKLARAYYQRAVAMEIVDGEMEVLAAGEWRTFKPGRQPYAVNAESAQNLPPGDFLLTVTEDRLKLEWTPKVRGKGLAFAREVRLK